MKRSACLIHKYETGQTRKLQTFPEDCTPLHKQRNTISHAANRQAAIPQRIWPVSSMPDESPSTWLL